MPKYIKDQVLGCRLSRIAKHKLRVICQKTKLNQTEFIEKMIEAEYERMKNQAWESVHVQLDIFADQPIDNVATLFDNTIEKTA